VHDGSSYSLTKYTKGGEHTIGITRRYIDEQVYHTVKEIDKLSQVADRIIVIHCCSSYDNVGEHYRDFTEVRDDEIERIMKK
jgi:hypothetical protein